jgi:serine/threonine protein phosphatase PrpC
MQGNIIRRAGMLCPLCHTQNRDNAKFCKGCGQLLAVEVVAAGQPEAVEQHGSAGQAPTQRTQGTQLSSPSSEDAASAATPEDTDTAAGAHSAEPAQPEASPASASGNVHSTFPAKDAAQVYSLHDEQSAPAPTGTTQADAVDTDTDADAYANLDVSQLPTQIWTPQQRLAFQSRRWQQDTEDGPSDETYYDDISEAPTMFAKPQSFGSEARSYGPPETAGSNIDDAPTIYDYDPSAYEKSASAHVPDEQQTAQDVAENSQDAQPAATAVPDEQQENRDDTVVSSQVEDATTIPVKENNVEQSTNTSDSAETTEKQSDEQTTTEASSAQSFPMLEVGDSVVGRYEVTQVVSDGDSEHVYIVTDHQGYQHCWNCASEQNAEGDEFCIDCGAELLNAAYILHAYAPTAPKGEDAQVLQGTIINTFVDQGSTYVVEQPQATQTAFPNGAHLLAACDSDAGTVRRSEPNEDSTLVLSMQRVHESISSPAGLFVIADGMGGHANGQGASRLTIALLAERVTRELLLAPLQAEKAGEAAPTFDDDSFKELLRGAIEEANTALCQSNQKEKSDMGSTLTGFMVVGDYAYIFNVGDSRTYMLRDEKLYQLTNDHSLVGQLVAGGLIEPDDVYTHPQRNQIFRSIGDKQNVQVDLFTQQVHPGDVLLSCSDGLWEMVRDPQITEILNHAPDPQVACTQLLEAANANGGEDNVSAVVVYVR